MDSRSILLNVDRDSQFNWFCRNTSSTLIPIELAHTLPNAPFQAVQSIGGNEAG